ncbi:hypothetical protein IWW54_004486 [Coemansia sp. RSA 2705]|nr:hypothetical protein IWW54_004486 [Coemansia sp. RSA 2705]
MDMTNAGNDRRRPSPPLAAEEQRKRQRLNVSDGQSYARMESILREQLDLELYLKQKEVNTISEHLRHSEALLDVLESAIQSQQQATPTSSDAADGFLSYFHRLNELSQEAHEHWERPRRAAAAPARYTTDYYDMDAQSTDDDGGRESTSASIGKASHRRTPARTPRLATLTGQLDAEQMTSVNDALDFISKRQAAAEARAESSDADSGSGSDSGAWNNPTTSSKHHAQLKGAPVRMQPARESRFHVIRRVMLGNTSQFVDPARRPPGKERSTHKWTLYIRGAAADESIGGFIRKARVFLHPSYRPDDIVDLTPPMLELTRWGWGEFPVRVQIFFSDKRNKPVDLVHILKLDDSHAGEEVTGSETPVDLELDRRGFADDGRSVGSGTVLHGSLLTTSPPPTNPLLHEVMRTLCSLRPLVLDDVVPLGSEPLESPEQILGTVPPAVVETWTWGVAVSEITWRQVWPVGKRLLSEYSRNRALLSLLAGSLRQVGVDNLSSGTTSAEDSDAKYLAERVIRDILNASGAAETAIDRSVATIYASDSATCRQTVEMFCLWAKEAKAARPLQPDHTRGMQQKSYAWSLKRWLRLNGCVPLPVLSPDEQQLCLPDHTQVAAAELAMADAHAKSGYQENGSTRGRHSRSRLDPAIFCNVCGVLLQPSTSGLNLAEINADSDSQAVYCTQACESVGKASHATTTSVDEILAALPTGWDASDDDARIEVALTIDDEANDIASNGAETAVRARIMSISDSLRNYHLNQQRARALSDRGDEPMDADGAIIATGADNDSGLSGSEVDDEAIDWIWSVVQPLELNCATASRLSVTSRNSLDPDSGSDHLEHQIRLPNSTDEALGEALDQRLVVGRLLLDVTRLFLRDLVAASDQTMRGNRVARCVENDNDSSAAIGQQQLMLMPLHVLAAVKQDPQAFDVCSNANLGSSSIS